MKSFMSRAGIFGRKRKHNGTLSKKLNKILAFTLCLSMVSNMTVIYYPKAENIVSEIDSGTEDENVKIDSYELRSADLYTSIYKALKKGKTFNSEKMVFAGMSAWEYAELFDTSTGYELYSLTLPDSFNKKYKDADTKLKVFMMRPNAYEDDDANESTFSDASDESLKATETDASKTVSEKLRKKSEKGKYVLTGDEEIIFMLQNSTNETKKASVTVGRKTTGEISVCSKKKIPGLESGDDTATSSDYEQREVLTLEKILEQLKVQRASASDYHKALEDGETEVATSSDYKDPDNDSDVITIDEAADSDSKEITQMNGYAYGAVKYQGAATVAYVTTAGDLGLDELSINSPLNSDMIFEQQIGDVLIRVGADFGVVPENAELEVFELTEDGDYSGSYNEAKAALDKKETAYDGLMAYDIHFLDNEGAGIEPDGDVKVSMEVGSGVLPYDTELDSVQVQHIENTDSSLKAMTVADTADEADGLVEYEEDGAVAASFEVASFSYFTLTYKRGYAVNAYLYYRNSDGAIKPLYDTDSSKGDDLNFDSTNTSRFNVSDFAASWESGDYNNQYGDGRRYNVWLPIDAIAGMFAQQTSGYEYVSVHPTYENLTAGTSQIHWIRCNYSTSGGGGGWGGGGKPTITVTWRYSTATTKPTNASDGNEIQSSSLWVLYKYIDADSDLDDMIVTNGYFRAKLTDAQAASITENDDVTFVWYRSDNGTDWEEVKRKKITGAFHNFDVQADYDTKTFETYMYPGLDLADDVTVRRFYKADIIINEGTAAQKTIAFKERQVGLYSSVLNGSFESPDIDDVNPADGNFDFPNGTTGLYWQTTGSDEQIEIIDAAKKGSAYNCTSAAEGDQFAELNAEEVGALYQNVLTNPGATFYWQFSHRGRTKTDSMYLVIASTSDVETFRAKELADDSSKSEQAILNDFISEIKSRTGSSTTDGGKTIWKTSDNQVLIEVSDGNTSWVKYTGEYTIPDGQHATSFFFVSNETASPTLGNLLDNIKFSTSLPDPDPSRINISVTKIVEGINSRDIGDYKIKLNVTKADGTSVWSDYITFSDVKMDEKGRFTKNVNPDALRNLYYTYDYYVSGVRYYSTVYKLTEEVYFKDTLVNSSTQLASDTRNDITVGDGTVYRTLEPKLSTKVGSSAASETAYADGNTLGTEQNKNTEVKLTNSYKANNVPLYVAQHVGGTMGSGHTKFVYKASYTNSSGTETPVSGTFTVKKYDSGGNVISTRTVDVTDGTFRISADEIIELEIPYDSPSVEVTQTDSRGYTTTYRMNDDLKDVNSTTCSGTNEDELINYKLEQTIHFTSLKNGTAPTGISANYAVYLIMIGIGFMGMIAGAVLTIRRKRRKERR